jgi:hypothetical protein
MGDTMNNARIAVWLALFSGLAVGGVVGAGVAGLMHVTLVGSVGIFLMFGTALWITKERTA